MSDITDIGIATTMDTSVERTLYRASEKCLKSVIVMGWTEDGDIYFKSSKADGGDVLWLMENAKKSLLEVGE